MSQTAECFFDLGSPASYLAWTQLPRLCADAGATLRWRPMLLGGVFKATGNASPVTVPAKGRWMIGDLQRWAQRYGVPLHFNPHFPVNTLTMMRILTGVQLRQPAQWDAVLRTLFEAMWVGRQPMGDAEVLTAALAAGGHDAAALLALAADPEVKAALVATTEEAVARGVFGAPTTFVGDAMFFGQDRLDFVREALAAG